MHAHGPHDLPDVDLAQDAIFLDVDGTLLDIADAPEAVHVPETLREALARLMERSGGGVALISGRPIAALDRLFAPLQLPAAGCHGAQLRLPAGKDNRDGVAAPMPESMKQAFSGIARPIAGVQIEDKTYTLAIHYRGAMAREADVIAAVTARMKNAGPGYEMLRGKAVVEIKPVGFNKGTALVNLMGHAPFAGRRPVFFGDDVTDEDVFRALPEFGGVGISVGRRIHGAEYCVESPEDIRRWLRGLAGQ